jgi:hypothetical protein
VSPIIKAGGGGEDAERSAAVEGGGEDAERSAADAIVLRLRN